MIESQMLDMGMIKTRYNLIGREDDDIFIYTAPEGYHFESNDGINYGTMVYGGKKLSSTYNLVKDKDICLQ